MVSSDGLSPSDVALLSNRNNGGFLSGDDGILYLLLFMMFGGGWYRGGNNGSGAGSVGGDMLYPWINQAQTQWQGTSDIMQMLFNLTNSMQQLVSSGFFAQETSNNARQIANMQQLFGIQSDMNQGFNAQNIAMLQGFNALQAAQADCCCENRLATANQTATLLAEHCADRNALQMATRDIIDNQNRSGQMIMDKLCQLELDGVRAELANERRENDRLRQDNIISKFIESQTGQTATLTAGQMNAVDSLYNRLQSCPIQTEPIFGRQSIFTCPQNNNFGCGCGCNAA